MNGGFHFKFWPLVSVIEYEYWNHSFIASIEARKNTAVKMWHERMRMRKFTYQNNDCVSIRIRTSRTSKSKYFKWMVLKLNQNILNLISSSNVYIIYQAVSRNQWTTEWWWPWVTIKWNETILILECLDRNIAMLSLCVSLFLHISLLPTHRSVWKWLVSCPSLLLNVQKMRPLENGQIN